VSSPADGAAPSTGESSELTELVASRHWYHTIELAPGVVTAGWFDTRSVARRLPFPSLQGRRCLDVGTFDGFWAFEMERRGASEVVAIDILDPHEWDWPANSSEELAQALNTLKDSGAGFEAASQALGSGVERLEQSVYDLDPATNGTFDFVYVGSLLLHLRDPVRALEAVASVCRGELLVVDAIDAGLTLRQPRLPVAHLDGVGRPWWWRPNLAGLRHMVEVAGFRLTRCPPPFLMPPGGGHPRPRVSREVLANRTARGLLFGSRWGDPHAAVLAEPHRRASS
jgi:tRNA (mo5U34)-methyltransferase